MTLVDMACVQPGNSNGLTSAHDALLFALPVTILFGCPLVVLFFAAGQANFKLRTPLLPTQNQGHEGVSLPFDMPDELIEFVSVEEQLSGSDRVGDDVGTG